MHADIRIRPARPEERDDLTELTLMSKAIWGYDDETMLAFRDELMVTPERMAEFAIQVAETAQGRPKGLYGLSIEDGVAEVELLFVAPEATFMGIGRRLWDHLAATAEARGARRILIASDPDAVGFYEAMGARRIGTVPSGGLPGRRLPRLEYTLGRAAARDPA